MVWHSKCHHSWKNLGNSEPSFVTRTIVFSSIYTYMHIKFHKEQSDEYYMFLYNNRRGEGESTFYKCVKRASVYGTSMLNVRRMSKLKRMVIIIFTDKNVNKNIRLWKQGPKQQGIVGSCCLIRVLHFAVSCKSSSTLLRKLRKLPAWKL